jgi:hypothetical protein
LRLRPRPQRPAKIIKATKKVAYYPKTRCSPQSSARRLASPFFLPAASSYHEVLAVAVLAVAERQKPTPLAPRPRLLALVRASFMPRCV